MARLEFTFFWLWDYALCVIPSQTHRFSTPPHLMYEFKLHPNLLFFHSWEMKASKPSLRDSPGCPVGLCIPMQGVWVRPLIWELRSHMPQDQKTKTWNRSSVITNSIKNDLHFKKYLKQVVPQLNPSKDMALISSNSGQFCTLTSWLNSPF